MHEAEGRDQCGVQGGCGWERGEEITLVPKGDGAPESSGLAGWAGMVFWAEWSLVMPDLSLPSSHLQPKGLL